LGGPILRRNGGFERLIHRYETGNGLLEAGPKWHPPGFILADFALVQTGAFVVIY
jgi:hypothetical protein